MGWGASKTPTEREEEELPVPHSARLHLELEQALPAPIDSTAQA